MKRNIQPLIEESEKILQLAAEMSKAYYKEPLILAYSGGKDSDVMLRVAMDCLDKNDFEVINSHTSVDAPETVYHIRDIFSELESKGIKATVHIPRDKDGKQITMWNLIPKKKMPPTRIVRYCCQVLKETSTPNRMTAVGVRQSESVGRGGRDSFTTFNRGGGTHRGVHFNAEHARQVFEDAKRISEEFNEPVETPTPYDCTMIENMKKRGDTIVNPIYKWSDYDIWNYIQTKDIKVNPLYEKGYKRVGCVGCPMGNYRSMIREFKDYPTYKLNYIRAFDRMIKVRKEEGLKCEWENGEQVYLWWIGEWKHNVKGQITIDDFLKGEKE